MDIAGTPLQRREDSRIHQLDDGRDIFLLGEALDRDGLFFALIDTDDVVGEALARLFEHALRLLGFLEQVGDLRSGSDLHDDALLQQIANGVDVFEAARIVGNVEQFRAVLEMAKHIQRHKTGSGKVAFIAENAIQFKRMADRSGMVVESSAVVDAWKARAPGEAVAALA